MGKKNNYNVLMYLLFGLVLLLPFIIYIMVNIFGGDEYLAKSDILSYYASIGGACFTGYITAVGLFFTLKQNSETFSKQREIDQTNKEEDKINSVMPILKISRAINLNGYNQYLNVNYSSDGKTTCDKICIYIKNIGLGPAIKIKMKVGSYCAVNSVGIDNTFDLGTNEETAIEIRTKYESIMQNKHEKKYIPIVLECIDVYNKRIYKYYFNAINVQSSSFEVFENEKKEILIIE